MKKMVQKTFCDRCKKEITETVYMPMVKVTSVPDKITRIIAIDTRGGDLCHDCVIALLDKLETAAEEFLSSQSNAQLPECKHPVWSCGDKIHNAYNKCGRKDGKCSMEETKKQAKNDSLACRKPLAYCPNRKDNGDCIIKEAYPCAFIDDDVNAI